MIKPAVIIVGIWGFGVGSGNTLRVVSKNSAAIWLHVMLAIVMLRLGFGASGSKATA
jgi:hypothetical protein